MSDVVTTSVQDGVAVVRLDDGKMNALSHDVVARLDGALAQAEADAQAVCFVGNDRALSAGFDLSVMREGPDAARDLVTAGAKLIMRLYGHPQPTVVAVTGHALAAGALLVLACDTRVGADKPSKIGLNEVAIGMTLPEFAVELARERLSKRYATRACIQAEIYDPKGALAAGYLDQIVAADECEAAALAEAKRLAEMPGGAYGGTKRMVRGDTVERVLDGLNADMSRVGGPT